MAIIAPTSGILEASAILHIPEARTRAKLAQETDRDQDQEIVVRMSSVADMMAASGETEITTVTVVIGAEAVAADQKVVEDAAAIGITVVTEIIVDPVAMVAMVAMAEVEGMAAMVVTAVAAIMVAEMEAMAAAAAIMAAAAAIIAAAAAIMAAV